MQPGAMSYELQAAGLESDTASVSGTFIIPPVEGSNCRMRAYVNSASPHLQTLTCGPGRFYGPDAQFGGGKDEGAVGDPGRSADSGDPSEVVQFDVDELDPCGFGSICQPTWLGDGSCDAACNCPETDFDGRDCIPTE